MAFIIPLFLLWVFAAPALAQTTDIITTIAGSGTPGYGGDGGPAARAQFRFLEGDEELNLEEYSHLAVDAEGNVYVADQANDRIRKVAANGIITTVAGTGEAGFEGDGGPATRATLFSPISVNIDSAGNLFIVDQDNHRVRRVAPDGTISTIAGRGTGTVRGNGGPAVEAVLNAPGGLTLDAAGNIYISDTYSNQVRKVTATTGLIAAFAGTTEHDFFGDGFTATRAGLDFPAGLAVDAAGNVYIADQHNNRIRRVSTDGIITTFAGNGRAEFSGDGGPAVSAGLHYPADVAFDAAGNLYIADQRNNRIRKVTPDGAITTVVGNGERGFSGDGGSPLSASLNRPSGLAFGKDGNLYITDHYNYRIRRVVFNPPLLAAAPASLAFAATAGGNAPAPQALTLSNPGAGVLNYRITSNQAWLTAAPSSGSFSSSAPANITVRVNIANLSVGEHAGVLNIEAPGAANSPQVVQVLLTVRAVTAPPPAFSAGDVAHAASFVRGPVAPGQLISIFGSNLGPQTGIGPALDAATGRLATTRADVTVLFNDLPGPLFFVRRDQINVQVPYEIAGQTSLRIVVRYLATASAPVTVPVAATAPGIFAVSRGTGQAAILNQDSSFNSAENPAARGNVVQIYLTGQGATTPPAITGQLPQAPFPAPVLPVTVRIGGRAARTTFVGLAPGLAGLLQLNAVVPEDTTPGPNVALEVSIGSATSQPGVTLAVR